jgi:hypothetical protein
MKPRNINAPARNENTEQKAFVPIIPEEGLVSVQVGLLVDLGSHKKLPKFAKDNAGNREKDDDTGQDKILWPKAGAVEQKIGCYIDLLDQTHDYEGDIGVKNIRLPLHPVNRGMSDGLNFTTVAPRDPKTNAYIKGRPWVLASTSNFYKIAGVTKYEDGTKVADTIFKADYKNGKLNDISELLGKPFMFNLEVKVQEKDDKKYVNTKLKSPVPLAKGMKPDAALMPAVSVGFDDADLLGEKEEFGGVSKFDLIRLADLRKIVLAEEYEGSKMQEAVVERNGKDGEKELIEKAREISAKIQDSDRDLLEIRTKYPNGQPGVEGSVVQESMAPKAVAPKKPAANFSDMDDDVPF